MGNKLLSYFIVTVILSSEVIKGQIHDGWLGLQSPVELGSCVKDYSAHVNKPHPDIGLPIDEIIRKYGYPVQRVNVVTEDGYMLGLFRIPHGRPEISPLIPGQRRKAVYLAHGFFCNGHAWLVQPYSRNLAFLLADSGLDVFIGNARGTKYSQVHMDPAITPVHKNYWDFSWHEMGIFDIPAVLEAITKLTGEQKIYYVGHSMGGTQYIVGASERPEINDKIATALLLAPASTLYNARSVIYRFLLPLAYNLRYLLNTVLGGRIDQIQKLLDFINLPMGMICAPSAMACGACGSIMHFLFGYDHPQTNYTSLPIMLNMFLETMATKTMIHFAQGQATNVMHQFDYGSAKLNQRRYGQNFPPRYNFSRLTAPIVMYYGQSDNLVAPEDVVALAKLIGQPTVKELNRVNWPLFNHADFLTAKDADDLLYKDIRDKIVRSTYG